MDLKNGRDILKKKIKGLDIFNMYKKSFMEINVESSLPSLL